MKPITLTLPYPISANRYWATRIVRSKATGKQMSLTYITPEAKQYIAEIGHIARAAGIASPYDSRVNMHIKLYPHRPLDWQKRMRTMGDWWDDTVQCIDLGNCEKVLADAIEGVIYTNDKWIWHQEKDRMEPDQDGARVVITVSAVPRPVTQGSIFETAVA